MKKNKSLSQGKGLDTHILGRIKNIHTKIEEFQSTILNGQYAMARATKDSVVIGRMATKLGSLKEKLEPDFLGNQRLGKIVLNAYRDTSVLEAQLHVIALAHESKNKTV